MKEVMNPEASKPSPVNLKSLSAYLMGVLNGLRDGEITPNQGLAIAKVASQINMAYSVNLKRTAMQVVLEKMGKSVDSKLLDLDSKASDDSKVSD
jgi:hypothetical protein